MNFCRCGRQLPCKWHDGKQEAPKRNRQVRFSGGSKYREENGQFQAIRGR